MKTANITSTPSHRYAVLEAPALHLDMPLLDSSLDSAGFGIVEEVSRTFCFDGAPGSAAERVHAVILSVRDTATGLVRSFTMPLKRLHASLTEGRGQHVQMFSRTSGYTMTHFIVPASH